MSGQKAFTLLLNQQVWLLKFAKKSVALKDLLSAGVKFQVPK